MSRNLAEEEAADYVDSVRQMCINVGLSHQHPWNLHNLQLAFAELGRFDSGGFGAGAFEEKVGSVDVFLLLFREVGIG